MNTKEVARYLGLTVRTVHKLYQTGQLKYTGRERGAHEVTFEDARAYLDSVGYPDDPIDAEEARVILGVGICKLFKIQQMGYLTNIKYANKAVYSRREVIACKELLS